MTEADVRPIQDFEESFVASLPETARLLRSATLTVHPSVCAITLHGSRGPAGGHRPDSDVDLCLIVEPGGLSPGPELAALLHEVLDTTLRHWTGPVEADLAAVFDDRGCGLGCFEGAAACAQGGVDCLGLYKVQRGFHGFVENAGVRVDRMQPCTVIWRNPAILVGQGEGDGDRSDPIRDQPGLSILRGAAACAGRGADHGSRVV